jgi:hypothetical protein
MLLSARLIAEVSIETCVRLQPKCLTSGVKKMPAVS